MKKIIFLIFSVLILLNSQMFGGGQDVGFGFVHGGYKTGSATYFRNSPVSPNSTVMKNELFYRPVQYPVMYGFIQTGNMWVEWDSFGTFSSTVLAMLLGYPTIVHEIPFVSTDAGIYLFTLDKLGLLAGISGRLGMSSFVKGWPGGSGTTMLDLDAGLGLCFFWVPPVIKDFVTVNTYGTFHVVNLSAGEANNGWGYNGWGFRWSTLIRITPFPMYKKFALGFTPVFEYKTVSDPETKLTEGMTAMTYNFTINLWPF